MCGVFRRAGYYIITHDASFAYTKIRWTKTAATLRKKHLIVLAAALFAAALAAALYEMGDANPDDATVEVGIESVPDGENVVAISMTSSRPGCETASLCYVPAEITVSSGQTITWINEDRGFHTVTSGYYDTPDGSFDSEHLEPGQKFRHAFDESGTFHYYCRLHPWMEGTVVVS